MKLANILLEQNDEYGIDSRQQELESLFNRDLKQYSPSLRLGAYSQPREESDPLNMKGFGKVTFMHKDELPEQEFEKARNILIDKGYEITDDSNYYEVDERHIYPSIKFHFDLN